MTNVKMSVLGVVLCFAVVCAGIEALDRTGEEFPSNYFEDNLDIALQMEGLFRDDPPKEPTPVTCENGGTKKCAETHQNCIDQPDSVFKCEGCIKDYVKKSDTEEECVPETCDNTGTEKCDAEYRKCENEEGEGFKCGECKPDFEIQVVDNKEVCVPKTCDETATEDCNDKNKTCNYIAGGGFECGDCKADFLQKVVGNDTICFAKTCKNTGYAECDASNRNCKNKEKAGFECGECKVDFFENRNGTEAICIAKTCENNGTAECNIIHRECANKDGPGFECKECKSDYQKVGEFEGGEFICKAKRCGDTGKAECDAKHRICTDKKEAGFECGDCNSDYMQKGDGKDATCEAKTCENKGTLVCDPLHRVCKNKEKAGFDCGKCKPDFVGKEDTTVTCEAKTCANFGTNQCDVSNQKCKNKDGGGYECDSCKDGFVKEDEKCVRETCENAGDKKCLTLNKKCQDIKDSGFECTDCLENYVKKKGTNECLPEACDNGSDGCKHNGTCVDKLCECLPGFTGGNCEKITECETGVYKLCKGDKGSCSFEDVIGEVVCNCDGEKTLDTDNKYCRKPCSKNEECMNGKCDRNFCQCNQGYSGDICEIITGCIEKNTECENANAKCRLNETSFDGYCECNDQNYIYKNQSCETAKWCDPNPCKGGKCFFENGVGRCECAEKQYYDYKEGGCKSIDPCLSLTTPCPENKKCDSTDGKCKCIEGFKAEGEDCKPNACTKSPCFSAATCTESDKPNVVTCACKNSEFYKGRCLDGSCFLPGQNCSKCPSGMKVVDFVCEHEDGKKCDKDCGAFGWCIKNGEEEKCVCMNNPYTESKAGKCVLKTSACATGKIDNDDQSKCNCTTTNDKYKMSSNKITCEKKSCADEDVQQKCTNLKARCVDFWKSTEKSYECQCDKGYQPHPDTGVCTDKCSLPQFKNTCLNNKQTCFLTNDMEIVDCKCSPAFTFHDGRKRCEPSTQEQDFMLHNLPVKRDQYLKDGLIDIVKLNKDVTDAMEKIYSNEEVAFSRLYKYKSSGDTLFCDVWLQLQKSAAQNIVNRWKKQQMKQNDAVFLPPALLLSSEKVNEVKDEKISFCSPDVKAAHCGRFATCKGKECTCPEGFRGIESTKTKYGDYVTLHCEDIDECSEEKHGCTSNTTCSNTVGGYYCKCNPGFKKSEGASNEENTKPCIDLCTPNPCYKGKCDKMNNTVDCTCDLGYAGSFCNRADPNIKKAAKNTVVVGAVLGTLLGVVVLLFVFYVVRQRKNSYSEDFTPAPRIDNAEMVDRRPMRGVSNRAYQ